MNVSAVQSDPETAAVHSYRYGKPQPVERGANTRTGVSVVICTYKRPDSIVGCLHSLSAQSRLPDEIIVVDASPDLNTERAVSAFALDNTDLPALIYARVTGSRVGLTRQRNYSASLVSMDLVAFFDDDTVLAPECLAEMERVHRQSNVPVAGVGAYVSNEHRKPSLLWRLRMCFRSVTDLKPGRYDDSGYSIPWNFLPPTEELLEGDWLPGNAMMWRTELVRKLRFDESFAGYASGEDLEFSLRARREGKLFLAGSARLQHLHAPSGRPDAFRFGYMETKNAFLILKANMRRSAWIHVLRFSYALVLDTLLLLRYCLYPDRLGFAVRQCAGRFAGFVSVLVCAE
jgi:GT2 family glycosyltransferase